MTTLLPVPPAVNTDHSAPVEVMPVQPKWQGQHHPAITMDMGHPRERMPPPPPSTAEPQVHTRGIALRHVGPGEPSPPPHSPEFWLAEAPALAWPPVFRGGHRPLAQPSTPSPAGHRGNHHHPGEHDVRGPDSNPSSPPD